MNIEKYCNISSIMLSDFRALGHWQTPVSLCVCVCVCDFRPEMIFCVKRFCAPALWEIYQ